MSPSNVNVSQGLSIFRSLDLDETEEEVKGSEGVVFFVEITNTNVAARYVKLYDGTAASTTVGTTTPALTLHVAATSSRYFESDHGIRFANGITAAAVTGIADNDTTGAGANEVVVHIGYA